MRGRGYATIEEIDAVTPAHLERWRARASGRAVLAVGARVWTEIVWNADLSSLWEPAAIEDVAKGVMGALAGMPVVVDAFDPGHTFSLDDDEVVVFDVFLGSEGEDHVVVHEARLVR